MLVAMFAAGCGNSAPTQSQTNINEEEEDDQSIRRNPVFALFDSDGQGTYQLYRNDDKIATFTLEGGQKPLEMCSHGDNCYILVSRSQAKDSTDSVSLNAAILKNGRRIIEFDDNLQAMHFNMDEGHFYVLGKLGDTEYTVYRDGLRALSFPVKDGSVPADIHVFGQTIYTAMQRGKTTDIYKDNQKLYSVNGICKDLKVSFRGVYVLVNDTLYLDRNVLMTNEYYRHSDKEMYAFPTMIATSDKNVLVGSRASFDKLHTYAGMFVNQQTYSTIKPDDKHIGTSELSTVCCGVAVSNETYYYAVAVLNPDMTMQTPITYHFCTDHSESFVLKFDNDKARLLMMTSN
jgi:hypothetical protein